MASKMAARLKQMFYIFVKIPMRIMFDFHICNEIFLAGAESPLTAFKYKMAFKMADIIIDTLQYSRLSLSRIPRDSMKCFEISVPRHIRFAELRKK